MGEATVFFRILEMNGRLEMGRNLLRLEGSAPGFFSIGVIAEVLKVVGKVSVVREEWVMAEMRGAR